MKYKCISADSHMEIRPDRYAKQPDPEHYVSDVIERFNKYRFRGSK